MGGFKVEVGFNADALARSEITGEGRSNIVGNFHLKDEGISDESNDDIADKKRKRICGPSTRPSKFSFMKPVIAEQRRRLIYLIRKMAGYGNWKEASGALSILLKGTPRGSILEDRKYLLVAMELIRRFGDRKNYSTKIKQIYEIWMNKLAWTKKCSHKKHLIQLELALFCLTQGNITESHQSTKFLVQDHNSASESSTNLIHGLASYQLWYSGLPEAMQLKEADMDISLETSELAFSDDFYPETENSNDHKAVDIQDAQYDSDSSVGNDKEVLTDCDGDAPRKRSRRIFSARGFHINGSSGSNNSAAASLNNDNNFLDTSIFLAHGLDATLLPMRLPQSTEDLEQRINLHRSMVNEHYKDAVKHLRIALYSNPPLPAALLPLIQILLLGDRVEDALKEIEKFCHYSDTALPFRLRARLLECFCSNQFIEISHCHENVLMKDPTCCYSLEKLIRMHKNGNYSTVSLLEMIALHLDAASGKGCIWGEFASCLLEIQFAVQLECGEDQRSTNRRPIYKFSDQVIVSSRAILKKFFKEEARNSWRLRCRWWPKRHFSKKIYLSELESGNWQLLTSKAACASHLYGPRFEYVTGVRSSLRKEGNNDHISFLTTHRKQSLKLYEILATMT